MLNIGDIAPVFSLLDQEGNVHNLADYRGKTVLLYFYPKDDTPGCVKEACTIAEVYEEFENKGVKVFGVSPDDTASHKAFAEKYNLPFSLLSDPDMEVIKLYGAHEEGEQYIKRISYLISPEGNIAKVYPNVDPATHAMDLLKDLG